MSGIKNKYSENGKNGYPIPHWVEVSPSGELVTGLFYTDQKDSVTVEMQTSVNERNMQYVHIRQDVRVTYEDLARLRNQFDAILDEAVRRGAWSGVLDG